MTSLTRIRVELKWLSHGSQISHHRLRTLYKAPTACKYNVLRLCAGPARQQRYRVSMFSLKCDVKREVTDGLSEISNEIPFLSSDFLYCVFTLTKFYTIQILAIVNSEMKPHKYLVRSRLWPVCDAVTMRWTFRFCSPGSWSFRRGSMRGLVSTSPPSSLDTLAASGLTGSAATPSAPGHLVHQHAITRM